MRPSPLTYFPSRNRTLAADPIEVAEKAGHAYICRATCWTNDHRNLPTLTPIRTLRTFVAHRADGTAYISILIVLIRIDGDKDLSHLYLIGGRPNIDVPEVRPGGIAVAWRRPPPGPEGPTSVPSAGRSSPPAPPTRAPGHRRPRAPYRPPQPGRRAEANPRGAGRRGAPG